MGITDLITTDPETLSGTPVFTGTRVPIESLFDHLEAGESLDVFLDDFHSSSGCSPCSSHRKEHGRHGGIRWKQQGRSLIAVAIFGKHKITVTMNELIQELTTKAGLSEEQAAKAIEVIKEYITNQLPPMMHGMVDGFLKQQSGGASDDILG